MTGNLKIKEPVQPIEALVSKHYEDGNIEVEFPPSHLYSSSILSLVDGVNPQDAPIGSTIIVDSADTSRGMTSIRSYTLDGKILSDKVPGMEYRKNEIISLGYKIN